MTPQPGDSRGAPNLGLQHLSRWGEHFHPCRHGKQEAPICFFVFAGVATGTEHWISSVCIKDCSLEGFDTERWGLPEKHSKDVPDLSTAQQLHRVRSITRASLPSLPVQSTPCARAAQGWEGTRGTRGGPERGRPRAHPAPAGRAEPPAPSRGL